MFSKIQKSLLVLLAVASFNLSANEINKIRILGVTRNAEGTTIYSGVFLSASHNMQKVDFSVCPGPQSAQISSALRQAYSTKTTIAKLVLTQRPQDATPCAVSATL